MIKGVIFDLDGVLVFTDKYHYQAWKRLADEEGIEFNESINDRLRGVSRMASLEIILEKATKPYTQEEKEAMAEKKNAYYRELLNNLTPDDVTNESRQFLDELKEKGIKIAVGSSSKNTPLILEKIGLDKVFDAVIDGNMITKSKPDPEVFLKAASALGLEPEECLVIEDAEAGIQAASDGGFTPVGIGPAKATKDTLYPIDQIKEIGDVINKINTPLMRINHLKKVYPNGVEAIHDFSLEIYPEEFVVFVGPSGCGKSTVLRMIAGLEDVTDGEIRLGDKDITDIDAKDRNIAMVFQNYALYPHLTVEKNIAFPLDIEHVPFKHFFDFKYRKERKAKIKEAVALAAERIGLSEYLDRKPQNLSGGQRQRVALGRAIVRNPKVFLLDEPLSNLDAKMRVQMRSEITRLHDKLKTIFIYVTHDQVEAMTMGTKIVILKDGYIQQIGSPEEVFLNPVNQFVAGFIGTPQMNFIPATISKNKGDYFATFLNQTIKLDQDRLFSFPLDQLNQEVVLGVRPKAISVEGDLAYVEQGYKAKVSLFEQLGEDTLVYASMDGLENDLILSTTGLGRFHKQETISISFDLSNVCLFDKENGESLLK